MPRYYTAEEYTDMLITYGMAGENILAAAQLYAERFPDRERHPDHNVIFQCVQRARETGFLCPQRHAGVPMHRVSDEERILETFEENPGNSIRRVSRMLGLSHYMVRHILRVNGLHPYHYQRVQQLLARDQQQRVNFCGGIF